jgi:hypothetical protein
MTTPTDTETLIKTVDELRKYDHCFISAEGAEKFSQAFGFSARTHVETATSSDFQGLTLHDGIKSAKGLGAHELARQICHHAGVKYKSTMGRGSQLRECCDALEQWLNAR